MNFRRQRKDNHRLTKNCVFWIMKSLRYIFHYLLFKSDMISFHLETEASNLTITFNKAAKIRKLIQKTKTICKFTKTWWERILSKVARCFLYWEIFTFSQKSKSLGPSYITLKKMKNIFLGVSFFSLSFSRRYYWSSLLCALDELVQLTTKGKPRSITPSSLDQQWKH